MGWLIIGILIIYGWVEFEALFIVGDLIGGLASFLGIFVTALIGLSLLRSQGNAVMHAMRTQMAQGQTGLSQITDSLSLVLGAILMLLPGYVTDFVGVICFIPGFRRIIGTFLMTHLAGRIMQSVSNRNHGGSGGAGFSSDTVSGVRFHFGNKQSSDDSPSDFAGQQRTNAINEDFIEGEFSEKPTSGSDNFDKDK